VLIRKTVEADLAQIEEIYQNAKKFMRGSGNPNQWNGERPNIDSAREDMEKSCGFVAEDNGEILAVFYFSTDEEPTYKKIYEGNWLNDEPYGVIHRIAVKMQGHGIIDHCINECLNRCNNLRIDTHRDNLPMQRALLKRNFKYCGIIYLENGDERLAYQKTNNDK
jgi:RimJ/RimL family protein N-acetyltransferase